MKLVQFESQECGGVEVTMETEKGYIWCCVCVLVCVLWSGWCVLWSGWCVVGSLLCVPLLICIFSQTTAWGQQLYKYNIFVTFLHSCMCVERVTVVNFIGVFLTRRSRIGRTHHLFLPHTVVSSVCVYETLANVSQQLSSIPLVHTCVQQSIQWRVALILGNNQQLLTLFPVSSCVPLNMQYKSFFYCRVSICHSRMSNNYSKNFNNIFKNSSNIFRHTPPAYVGCSECHH